MSKLEEKELKPLQENQNKINQVITNLGFSVLQKHGIKKSRKKLFSEIEELDKEQQDLKKELEDSYGKISVNLQTGEYEDIKEDDNIK